MAHARLTLAHSPESVFARRACRERPLSRSPPSLRALATRAYLRRNIRLALRARRLQSAPLANFRTRHNLRTFGSTPYQRARSGRVYKRRALAAFTPLPYAVFVSVTCIRNGACFVVVGYVAKLACRISAA